MISESRILKPYALYYYRLLGLQPVPYSDDNSNTIKNSHNDVPESLKDKKHGIKMGVVSEKCDNAKVTSTNNHSTL